MLFAVDHPSLPPFEPIIRSIVRMAFTGGLQALASLGVTMEAVKTDPKARSRFLRGCHRGYDKAQQQIGAYLIEMEGRVDALEAESKALRASRDPARRETELRIRVVRNRQLVLRRLADAILCAITHFDTWVIKRLILDRHLRSIDPRVLRKTIQVATQRNADNRLRFSLVADLTTIVQIGDLVEISFDSRDPRWKVI